MAGLGDAVQEINADRLALPRRDDDGDLSIQSRLAGLIATAEIVQHLAQHRL